MTTEPRVDFIVRSDGLIKDGGDMVQVREYSAHLEKHGFSCRIVPFSPGVKVRRGAIVHIINIDRPFDFLVSCKLAKDNAIVVSPIHHELAAVRRMRRAERGLGARSLLGRVLSEGSREWIATLIRSMRQAPITAWPTLVVRLVPYLLSVRSVWSKVGRRLDDVHAVLLLAPGEGVHIASDTGWRGENGRVIPNGAPELRDGIVRREWSEREIDIVMVGRIEPRKRQVDFIEAAATSKAKILIVGPISQAGTTFEDEFRRVVRNAPNAVWAGGLPREEVLLHLGNSKVLANPSWVEVQSLVELEAARMGCRVASSGSGNSSDWLPEHVVALHNDDVHDLLRQAEELAELPDAPTEVEYQATWDSVSRAIRLLYEEMR